MNKLPTAVEYTKFAKVITQCFAYQFEVQHTLLMKLKLSEMQV
jgi:hypothetical protein